MNFFKKKKAQLEYDEISENYEVVATDSDDRRYLFVPTVLKHLPPLNDKKVLDLATGEGYWARLLKNKGAKEVIGVDISPKMIEIARSKEEANLLGIEYRVGDACKLDLIYQVDLVFAAFLLHYAETREEVFQMCSNISSSLKSNGEFISLCLNPLNPVFDGRKYFFSQTAKLEKDGFPKEGSKMTLTLFDRNNKVPPFTFTDQYWRKETYEEALKEAGLVDIRWNNFIVSKEGLDAFPPNYWDDYLKHSNTCLLTCRKK